MSVDFSLEKDSHLLLFSITFLFFAKVCFAYESMSSKGNKLLLTRTKWVLFHLITLVYSFV